MNREIFRKAKGNKVFCNIGSVLWLNGFTLLINSLVGVILVRHYGAEINGIISILSSTFIILSALATMGMDTLFANELAKRNSKFEIVFKSAFLVNIIMSVFCYLAYVIFVYCFCNNDIPISYIIVYGLSLLATPFYLIQYWLQAEMQVKAYCLGLFFLGIAYAFARVLCVILDAKYFYLVLCFFIYNLGFSGLFIFLFKKQKKLQFKVVHIDWELIRKFFTDGVVIAITGVATCAYMKCDQIMVADMVGYEAAGKYSVAVSWSECWYFVLTSISAIMYPILLKFQKKKSNCEQYFKVYMRIMVLIAVGIGIVFFAASDWFILTLYGAEYEISSRVLKIYVWSGVAVGLGLARSPYLIHNSYKIFYLLSTVGAALLNILLNYFLIRVIGIEGAAYSTLVSYVFSAIVGGFFWKKTRRVACYQIGAIFIPYLLKNRGAFKELITFSE